MRSLPELQRDCRRAFRDGEAAALLGLLAADGELAAAQVQVYQNNAREIARLALAASFPVVEQLVGELCFRGLARVYALRHESRSGDLQHYAHAFPELLEELYDETEFDYLADVARLEWCAEQALLEPDGHGLDPAAAQRGLNWATLELGLCPSVRLIASRYPILDIWRAHHRGGDERVDLGAGAQHVALKRAGGDVLMYRLEPDAFLLAQAFVLPQTLAQALRPILEARPQFDLGRALHGLLTTALLDVASRSFN